ncbi:MAG: NGG1p interacting factor NIF3, partial [Candidatus Latescibacteria bacterium]|nr:NGG1p interacting factor NIF3 [Candidatus Latescibacterota bacterium]
MTLRDFYESAIEVGKAADRRGKDALGRHLEEVAARYEDMSDRERRLFDGVRLENPFGDTRIVHGDPETELGRVVLGIDIDGAELLLASELTRLG